MNPRNGSLTGIPALIISLGRPRNCDLRPSLEAFGFEVFNVSGVDGRTLSAMDLERVKQETATRIHGRPMTSGEIGCSLGHLSAYDVARSLDADWTLVCEDDAIIRSNIVHLEAVLQSLPQTSSLVLNLYSYVGNPWRRKGLMHIHGPIEQGGTQVVGRYFKPPQMALAYCLNRSAVDWAASRTTVDGGPDWPLWADKLDFWGVYPWMATPMESVPSLIDPDGDGRVLPKVQHGSVFSPGRRLGYLLPRVASSWAGALGGWRPYISRVAIPRTHEQLSRIGQSAIKGVDGGPFIR